MNRKYSIIINDGYKPFIDKGILSAKYSLTNIHSNCEGYKIFALWLKTLTNESQN